MTRILYLMLPIVAMLVACSANDEPAKSGILEDPGMGSIYLGETKQAKYYAVKGWPTTEYKDGRKEAATIPWGTVKRIDKKSGAVLYSNDAMLRLDQEFPFSCEDGSEVKDSAEFGKYIERKREQGNEGPGGPN